MKLFFNFKKTQKGFTLIEALVSIALILIAVIGPLSLTLNSVTSVIYAKNRVIASYLGEEVIENIRNYRDSFSLACSSLNINYTSDGLNIIDGACVGNGANLYLSPSYFIDGLYTPSSIAWKLFLESMDPLILNNENYLDNSSFSSSLSTVYSEPGCLALNLSENNGYNCFSGTPTNFKRVVSLSKVANNTLRVKVKVVYAKSSVFGIGDKYVEIVSYIYER